MVDLGIAGSGPVASVDPTGTIRLGDRPWSARWWVAGEDRWHRADADAAVRQRLVDDLPIVETALRVPSGDAVATTYAFAGAAGEAEVASRLANDSPVPVAAALVVGPADAVELDDRTIRVDGVAVAALDRRPAASVVAGDLDGLAVAVDGATGHVEGGRRGWLAVVVPLPHAQAVGAVLGFDGDRPSPVPPVDNVAAGWEAQLDRGVRLSVPDPVADAVRRARVAATMGIGAWTEEAVAAGLELVLRLGWFEDAAASTEELVASQGGRGGFGHDRLTLAAVEALAAWRVAGVPPEHLEPIALAVAAGAHRLRRRRTRGDLDPARVDAALAHAAWFLVAAGEDAAAHDLRPAPGPVALVVDEGDDPVRAGVAALDALGAETDDGVALLPGWRSAWAGAPLEVTGLPTRFGRASYAVRWHGARPALLWELDRWEGSRLSAPVLTAPGLDPSWSTRELSGEALLAAPDVAGHVPGDRGDDAGAGSPGGSFS
jgi:hypothetical protein